MDDRPAKRWKLWHMRPRLSVRVLMVVVLVLGGVLGWIVHQARVQRDAVTAITRAGGEVFYEQKFRGSFWKEWLVARLGVDYFESPTELGFYAASGLHAGEDPLGEGVDDETMAEVGKLHGLLSLSLDGKSRVTDAGLARLQDLSHLQKLYLGPMNIRGHGLACLGGMSRLEELNLGRLDLADADLVRLEGLSTLTFLSVSGRRLTDEGLAPISTLTKLDYLRITNSPITGAGLVHLAGLPLTKLDLDGTQVQSIEPLRGLTKLRSLGLQRTPLDDVGLAPVAGFRNLENLTLSRTRISDAALASIAGLSNLTFLNFNGTHVGDEVVTLVVNLPKLFILDLSETRVTDAGLRRFPKLPRRLLLYLHGSDVTAEGVAALKARNPTMDIER